jgi:hypothetical protein
LIDESLGVEVHIIGDADAGASIGESGETFLPIGRQDPVRIVDSVRGIEGTIAGEIMLAPTYPTGNRTVATERANYLTLKGTPTDTRRLVFGRDNIPVVCGEFELSPSPDPEEHYDVSFDFWQVGEFDVVP